MQGAPVIVLNQNVERDTGRRAQLGNIAAAKAVADIIRTTLGPRSMLKMILDPMGGIVMTNDGNAILREIDVSHPAAKSMIELSRTQDEEVGDGTTSVIILAGEMLQSARPFLERRMHPRTIVTSYNLALSDAIDKMKEMSKVLDLTDRSRMLDIIRSTIGTKFLSRYGDLVCNLAFDAVMCVREELTDGRTVMDVKRFARVEKVPGGQLEDSIVLDGIMLNKDVVHPKMRRKIENPKILCLDCALEYSKGESHTIIEIKKEIDFEAYLKIEEDNIRKLCDDIIKLKPDVVTTEKGCSDLAQHFLVKAGITVLRRLKKTDNTRLARATGATIGHRPELMKPTDIGTKCGLYEVRQVGDEYFSYFVKCDEPKACTVLLRGGSKDILQEMDRNLQDAMAVTRNMIKDPRILPGGGATEMAVSNALNQKSYSVAGVEQRPYRAVAGSLEVIPRTLIQNCGGQPIKELTELRAIHARPGNDTWGIDGNTGAVADMNEIGIWEPFVVKAQFIKTAMESASMLLRIDDVVSGLANKEDP